MHHSAPMYDPMDTLSWMIDEARAELARESALDAKGRTRKKGKAQREAERIRFEILCEVMWNVTGRPEPLEQSRERLLAA